MYKLITLSLVTGLVLGWFAHERWDADPVQQTESQTPSDIALQDSELPAMVSQPDSVGLVDGTSQLLQDGANTAAVDRYESCQALADEACMQQARDAVLLLAQQQIQAGDYVAAAQALQRFLLASYRDVDARLLLAEISYRQQDFRDAIEQLYEARGYAFRPEMLARITRRIRKLVDEQASIFSKHQNSAGLLALFQDLTQREPDYAAYFIELAIIQLALENRAAAQRSLTLVMNDPDVGEQARVMLASLQDAAAVTGPDQVAAVAGVPLIRSGQHFLVDVTTAEADSLRLLIDTGASMTMLTAEALQRHGLRYRETGRSQLFSTANGQLRAPIYVLESLSVGDWYVQQLEVGVLDLGAQAGIDGLLGMNFLSQFRFFIDQNEPVLRLSIN